MQRIEGFERGIRLPREGSGKTEGSENNPVPFLGSRLEDSYLANNTYNLSKKQRNFGEADFFPDYFEIVNTTFDTPDSNIAPTAIFSYQSVGSQGVVTFDASDSFDNDPPKSLELAGNAIASYGWDLNNDGKIDQFGRQVNHRFDTAGSHQVTLTVWDSQGATGTITQQIQVNPTAYPNLITDGTFSTTREFGGTGYSFNSARANQGWIASNWSLNSNIGNGGAAVVSGGGRNVGIGQILLDNGVRRGQQTLSMDIKNTEGAGKANEITVSVWGVDGEFDGGVWNLKGPNQVGAIPMTKENLLQQTVGGSTFNWTTFNWEVDFGEGYQFLVFQVAAKEADPDNGDFIAIDNISIDDTLINSNGTEPETDVANDALVGNTGVNVIENPEDSHGVLGGVSRGGEVDENSIDSLTFANEPYMSNSTISDELLSANLSAMLGVGDKLTFTDEIEHLTEQQTQILPIEPLIVQSLI